MIRRWHAGGLLVGALPLLLLVAACTAEAAAPSTTTASVTVTTEPQPSPPTTAAATTVPAVDGAALLGDAIAATGDRYRFASTVEAGDELLATIDGTVSGITFDALIDAGDVAVEYRKTDEGEWVRQGDGEWAPLEAEPAPTSAPLAALTAPLSAALASDDGSIVVVDAVFAGADLGASAEEVTVRITVSSGVVKTIGYTTTLGDGTVTVGTVISDVGAVESIPSP